MPDLRLVGVHDDGQHLLLVDDGGERYLLAVDEALRAAVRHDRASLSSLRAESPSALRPREVQARIRAGATSEEVAVLAGWSVEKVRRYEGPILAERAHVAELGRRVRLRRRGGEPVLLGAEVAARLEDRGVAAESVVWDSWRTEDGPWTVVVYFVAGGRERQARWHLDLAASAVTPVDDEARWLSEDSASADGPVAGLRLAAVSSPGVYDIEADGGVASTGGREAASGSAGSLDLVTAMRSRRREAGRGMPARPARTPLPPATDDPAAVPGAAHPAHGANRRRPQRPEPLDLDPTLMDDPPAAHPPASAHQDLAPAEAPQQLGDLVDVPLPLEGGSFGAGGAVEDAEVVPEGPVVDDVAVLVDEVAVLDEGAVVDEGGSDEVAVVERVAVVETVTVIDVPVDDVTVIDVPFDDAPGDDAAGDAPADDAPAGEAPGDAAAPGAGTAPEDASADPALSAEGTSEQAARPAQRTPQRTGKPRSGARNRGRRSSVPSWDDIMFGAKRD